MQALHNESLLSPCEWQAKVSHSAVQQVSHSCFKMMAANLRELQCDHKASRRLNHDRAV